MSAHFARRFVFACLPFALIIFVSAETAVSATRKSSRRPVQGSTRRAAACKACHVRTVPVSRKKSSRVRAKSARKPPCQPKGYLDPAVSRRFEAALRDMKRAGIKPVVTSGWRSSDRQAWLYRCSHNNRCRRANPGLYQARAPGSSLHEAGFAVDISGIATGPRGRKRLTPQGRRIIRIMRAHGFSWPYGLADPAHFEANPRNHGYRSASQAIKRSQARSQARCQVKPGHRRSQI
jgi:hypothetical protein